MNCTGKIHCITVNNFIVYDSVQMFPGEYLNVICGPNGTGKSTLVAAIVVAMGGSCSTLSRGKTLVDFIKNGQSKAAVAVQLYKDNERNIIEFYRSFDKKGGGTWKINKQKVTQHVYLDKVKEFNIQVDNLTQFLPQDRVQDFARMSPEEIFVNTIKSVCTTEVQEQYDELREMEDRTNNSSTEVTKWKTDLKESEDVNAQLKERIDNMQQRSAFQEKLEVAKIKRGHLQLDVLKGKCDETKRDLDDAKRALKEHQKTLAPIHEESREYTRQVKKTDDEITAGTNIITSTQQTFRNMERQLDEFEDKVRMAKVAVANAKQHKASQQQEVIEETTLLSALVEDLKASSRQQPELGEKKKAVQARITEFKRDTMGLERHRQELHELIDTEIKPEIIGLRRKIGEMRDAVKNQLAGMESRFPDMHKAALWLRDNRQKFRGRVYDPIVIELKLKDGRDGKYLENLIPIRDLTAIVCEDVSDMKALVKELTQEMRLQVNILHSEAATQLNYKPRVPIQQLRQYGFTKYVLEMVEAPIPILNFLCKMYQLHNVPVGAENVDVEQVTAMGNVNLFFTPTHRYSVTKSKYSTATSTTCIEIKGKQLLSVGVDENVVAQQRRLLERTQKRNEEVCAEVEDCERKIGVNETKVRDANVELKDIEGKIQQFVGLSKRVKIQQTKLKNIRDAVIDVDAEEAKCKATTVESTKKMFQLLQKMANETEKVDVAETDLMYKRDWLKRFHTGNADLKARLSAAEVAVEAAQKLVDNIQRSLEGHKRQMSEKKEEIKNLVQAVFPGNTRYTELPDYRELPQSDEELMEAINTLQIQVDCMEGRNEQVIEEYERREKKIEELRERIAGHKGQQKKLQGEMEKLHSKWFPKINAVVATINAKFANFMASMEYAGEVTLSRMEDYAYTTYGITIRVMYRVTETLQKLNSYLQSGGERTVAIATYTLALQQLSQVPFRCVDEINQGMDPRNERKIFEMLVDETSQAGMSQYFFITPKLLPGLKTNELMEFHIPYNGPYVQSPTVFLQEN